MAEEKVRSYRLHEQTKQVVEYEGRLVIEFKDYRPLEITSKRGPCVDIASKHSPLLVIEKNKKEKCDDQ